MRNAGLKCATVVGLVLSLATGCATHKSDPAPRTTPDPAPRTTSRDKTLKGAGIGAAAGAATAVIAGKREAVEKDTLLVRFDSDILFDTGSTTLGPAALGTVHEVADVLADYSKTAVVVQGHTDSTGPADYNQDLSERRAETVGGALVARGVAPQRLVATGYGESLPVASNGSERGRRLNRRVAILLKAKAS
jgi:outer membrane protein OmpA-like peptidoglycan-associated protein